MTQDTQATPLHRIALGLSYRGTAYQGWQSQLSGQTVQDKLESALGRFCATGARVSVHCAGRTDSGVHALQQVVHFDTPLVREMASWARGVNRFLPDDISVRWAQAVAPDFHCRSQALTRRYVYVLLDSPVRPALGAHRVGWTFRSVDAEAMQKAANFLLGEHDFSSFRAAACQALSPLKKLHTLKVTRQGVLVLCEFEASAFLHHMVRNIMACLVAVGRGSQPPEWLADVLAAKTRLAAAATFEPDGLYFLGPSYAAHWGLPDLLEREHLLAALFS